MWTPHLRHLALAAALLTSAAAAPGCAPYSVVQRSGPPSALQGAKLVLVRFDWSQVQVLDKSEADYLAEKSAEERADFAQIKTETDAAILRGMQDQAGQVFAAAGAEVDPNATLLVVHYGHVQTGIYTPVFSLPSKLAVRFAWSREGQVTDVIEANAAIGASLSTPSDHQRMEMAGKLVGKAAGRFFVRAQSGK